MTEETALASHAQLRDYSLSVDEAARVLGLSTEEVLQSVHSGVLPSIASDGSAPVLRLAPEEVLSYRTRNQTGDLSGPKPATDQRSEERFATPKRTTEAAFEDQPVASNLLDDTNSLLRMLIEQLTESLSTVNQRLADENVRLRTMVTEQAQGLSQHREDHAHLQQQLEAIPDAVDGLRARLDAVQMRVEEMRALQVRESEQAYRIAMEGLRHRPWWSRIPDIG